MSMSFAGSNRWHNPSSKSSYISIMTTRIDAIYIFDEETTKICEIHNIKEAYIHSSTHTQASFHISIHRSCAYLSIQ
jgi:hypothetical protein